MYVATPHSHHFQNTIFCLEAGKNVLCEKAFTVNAAQAKKLIETAKSKGLFLMEAVWTRYFPLSLSIRKMVENGDIGAVYRVQADLSFNENVDGPWGPEHRMYNMDLAGGALLDRKIIFCLQRSRTDSRLQQWASTLLPGCSSAFTIPCLRIAENPQKSLHQYRNIPRQDVMR